MKRSFFDIIDIDPFKDSENLLPPPIVPMKIVLAWCDGSLEKFVATKVSLDICPGALYFELANGESKYVILSSLKWFSTIC